MKTSIKFAALFAGALLSMAAIADDIKDIQAAQPVSAYVQDARGVIARDPFGLCWRTGYWTPANAVAGCDGEIAAPAAPVAPAADPAPAVQPAPVVKAPAPVAEKVTYAADAFFDFDKAVLKPAGKTTLNELAEKLQNVKLEVIVAVGHTDSVGNDKYNQKLSERRAAAVKAYLVSKGIEASRVYTEGKGEKQPAAANKTKEGRAKNRRVEIEVVGTR